MAQVDARKAGKPYREKRKAADDEASEGKPVISSKRCRPARRI